MDQIKGQLNQNANADHAHLQPSHEGNHSRPWPPDYDRLT